MSAPCSSSEVRSWRPWLSVSLSRRCTSARSALIRARAFSSSSFSPWSLSSGLCPYHLAGPAGEWGWAHGSAARTERTGEENVPPPAAERLDEVVHGVADALLDLWVFGPDGVQLQGYRPNELFSGRSAGPQQSQRR